MDCSNFRMWVAVGVNISARALAGPDGLTQTNPEFEPPPPWYGKPTIPNHQHINATYLSCLPGTAEAVARATGLVVGRLTAGGL